MTVTTEAPQAPSADSAPVGLGQKIRSIHPLMAMMAIAATAVCLIAAVQFIAPNEAKSDLRSTPDKAAASHPARAQATAPAAVCADCGEVVGLRTRKEAGEGSGVGAVAGGLLGGVVGHQFGAGRGKDAMTIAGAIGGAVAGNQVEKQVKAKTLYLIDIRMDDGSTRTLTRTEPPGVAIGSKVRIAGDQIAVR